jgi:hypothetical protein
MPTPDPAAPPHPLDTALSLETTVQLVQRAKIHPGDTLVLTVGEALTEHTTRWLERRLSEVFPEAKPRVIVLPPGSTLSIIEREHG